jgi:hypothetical protein
MPNYVLFPIDNFLEIQKELQHKFSGFIEGSILKTKIFEWSQENFGQLYDQVNKKLVVRRARLFLTPPHRILDYHIDGNRINENFWALNIPIDVPLADHWHEWYDYTGELTTMQDSVYTDYFVPADTTKLTISDRLLLTEPHLVKVGIMHRVVNNTDKNRLIVSIRFDLKQ